MEKVEKQSKALLIFMYIIAACQTAITIAVCIFASSRAVIVIDVLCLMITAFLLGECRGADKAGKRLRGIIEGLFKKEAELIGMLSSDSRIVRHDPVDIIEIKALVRDSFGNTDAVKKCLARCLGEDVFKYARVLESDIINGPLDPSERCYEARLRVVPFKDGGTGCGD